MLHPTSYVAVFVTETLRMLARTSPICRTSYPLLQEIPSQKPCRELTEDTSNSHCPSSGRNKASNQLQIAGR